MKPQPVSFKSIKERDDWMMDNAEYFTVTRHEGGGVYFKKEVPTYKEAFETAMKLADINDKAYMIYAVVTPSDAFVGMVKPKGW